MSFCDLSDPVTLPTVVPWESLPPVTEEIGFPVIASTTVIPARASTVTARLARRTLPQGIERRHESSSGSGSSGC